MKNKPYPLYSLPVISDLKDMVRKRAEAEPEQIAFSFAGAKNSTETRTCRTFSEDIDALGTYFYARGYRNAHIGIVGENSYHWLVAFMALANGGNVAVPIGKEYAADKIEQLLAQSDCKAVIVSPSYAKLVADVRDIEVFTTDEFPDYISKGTALIESGMNDFTDYAVDPDELGAIFFTSGTTGDSKGVMLSHRNMAEDINSASRNFEPDPGVTVAVLPFHHTFGLITAVFKAFNYRLSIHINKGLRYVQEDLKTIKPQTLFLVPLFVETFYRNIISTARKSGKEKTLDRAAILSDGLLKVGVDVRAKLFKSVQAAFGGRLTNIISGGAALDPKYVKAFRTWGVNILNGYGITECSPVVSVNRNQHWRDGSVGQIIDCCEVKIAEDDEILVKGDNVMMGYYKDDAATAAVLHDGWYSTGDLGEIDEDGFLFITGRKKNLIILSNGENVSPEEIEARILQDEAVSEVVVYGEDKKLVAEIFPDEEHMGDQAHFDALINCLNQDQPKYKQIRTVRLRDEEFEKNATKKILRFKVTENRSNSEEN